MPFSKNRPLAVPLQANPQKPGDVITEPLIGQAHKCSLFPGGVAMSYRPVAHTEPAVYDLLIPYLDRLAMRYAKPGYAIGYRNGSFTKLPFTMIGLGEYKPMAPSEEEIARFRLDLAEKAKADPSISIYLSQNPMIFG